MAQPPPPLRPFNANMSHSDRERFVCIYPQYINSKKTRQEGRKIKKENCVENPTYQEIRDVLALTNLNMLVENKIYPRERSKEFFQRGRIRLQLKNEFGSVINPDFAKRDQVLIYVGTMIPQLKNRVANPKGPVDDANSASVPTSQPVQNNKKTKGKGKR
ncbi:unnamed protein product [Diamesa serratosioi]